jgi:hypothetical protein
MLNGTLVIHLISVIADRFFLVYKALSATHIPSNVHCFLIFLVGSSELVVINLSNQLLKCLMFLSG